MGGNHAVTVESSWLLRPVLRYVGSERHSERLMVERLGAPAVDAMVRGGKLRLPRTVAFALLEDLAKQTGVHDLGLLAIGRRPLETLLDYLVVSSRTLGDALNTLTATNRLNNDARFELDVDQRAVLR